MGSTDSLTVEDSLRLRKADRIEIDSVPDYLCGHVIIKLVNDDDDSEILSATFRLTIDRKYELLYVYKDCSTLRKIAPALQYNRLIHFLLKSGWHVTN